LEAGAAPLLMRAEPIDNESVPLFAPRSAGGTKRGKRAWIISALFLGWLPGPDSNQRPSG